MKLLVIGSGGREHAICQQLLASDTVETVYCAPGNAGMRASGIELVPLAVNEFAQLVAFVKERQIDWTFVGPEQPLVAGIVDYFRQAGLMIFGPTKQAARLEGSKAFAKEFMKRHQIPTATYAVFTDYLSATAYVEKVGLPLVLKADGLAAGKGVVLPTSLDEAQQYLKQLFATENEAPKVVIEEYLEGEEFSLLTLVGEAGSYSLDIAQDHKRIYAGDKGPNTGGMGAYSPVPQIPSRMLERTLTEIVEPTIAGMQAMGTPFTGVLYTGVIATDKGPQVIEYNVRMGDPETQVILPRLTCDFAKLITDILQGRPATLTWQTDYQIGVVVAAQGYPGLYPTGMPIPQKEIERTVYYSGVAEGDTGELVAHGGRVFLVTAHGDSLAEAQQKVYQQLNALELGEDYYFRPDIGTRASKFLAQRK